MAAEQIQEILEYELRIHQVKIQVNETKDQLTVVINRPRDVDVDYSVLTETILTKLNSWELEVPKYKILGRIEKQTKPDWQQVFDNPHFKKGSSFLGLFNKSKKINRFT